MQLMRRNFGIAFVVILVFIPVLLHFDSNKQLEADYTSRIETNSNDHDEISEDGKDTLEVHEGYDDRYRLSENIDKIKLIRDNKTFQKLSYEEKKDVVTAILHCEGRYLGLEEFDIVFSEDLDIMTLGTCNFDNRTITNIYGENINNREFMKEKLRYILSMKDCIFNQRTLEFRQALNSLNLAPASKLLNILVIGPSRAGKSTLCNTLLI